MPGRFPSLTTAGRRRRIARLMVAYATLLVSCDSPVGPDASAIGRVDVTPKAISLQLGDTANLVAHVFDQAGREVISHVFWSTQDPTIATVSQNGAVVAVGQGATQIAASAAGVPGFTAVTVTQHPVALVRLTPSADNLVAGSTLQLALEVLDASGGAITGRPATWSTSDGTVATVSGSGIVTGVAPGTATIHATVEGIDGTAVITVLPAPIASITVSPPNASIQVGQTQPLAATARDAGGKVLTGRTIVWSSSSDAIAAVSQGGVVTGVGAGSVTITASSPGNGVGGSTPSATASITVTLVPVARVAVVPTTATVRVGDATNFTVNLFDAANALLSSSGRTVGWSSSDIAVATIGSTSGIATGVATGSATITATVTTPGQSGSVQGTASLTVSNTPVASVTVSPSPGTVHVGATYARPFTATPRDGQGNALSGRTVVWTSTNQAVAAVDPSTGLVTGVSQGSVQIQAVSEGVTGSAAVTVDLVPILSVSVNPPAATLVAPATQALSATPRDSAGNAVTGVSLGGRSAAWTSNSPGVATVNPTTGTVTAVSQGSATITATIGGTGGTSIITVLASAGAVTVALTSDSVIAPGTLAGTITVRDANQNPLASRPVTIGSSNAAVASVAPTSATTNNAGMVAISVSAVSSGNATISATSGSQTGVFALRVLNPVNAVTVSAPGDSIIGTGTLQASATLKDATNATLSGRPIAWSSAAQGTATVNATTGLITGIAPGTATITASAEGKSGALNVRVLPAVSSITVTSQGDSIIGSGTLQATATLRDASNNVITGRPVVWSTSNAGVATVNASSGLITGVAQGTATITAANGGTTGTLVVRVLAAGASVSIAAPVDSLIGPGTLSATVTVRDASNTPVAGRNVTIVSGNLAVATVSPAVATTDANGRVDLTITRVSLGSATITASSSGLNGSLTVRMLASVNSVLLTSPGDSVVGTSTLQLTATTRDASNNVLTGRPVSWTTNAPLVATVNGTTGLVTGVATGSATITATSEGITGTLIVRVLPAVASLPISAAVDSLIGSGSLVAIATVRDAFASPIGGRTVSFASSNAGVATVSPLSGTSGLNGQVPISVTWVAPGTATITATSAGVNGTFVVRMLAPVAAVAVVATGDSIINTGTLQATASLTDASSNPIAGRPITWTSSNPSVATVNGAGLVTGVAPGTTTISATSEGVTSSGVLVRVLAPVQTVSVASAADSIIGTGTLQLSAVTKDAGNNTLTGRPVTWSSGNTAIATVNQTSGLVTGVATGAVTITATSEGKSGTFDVRVLPGVASILVTAPIDSLIGAGTLSATATVRDVTNAAIAGRTVTITSSNPSVATVAPASATSDGFGQVAITVTRVGTGSVTITATSASVNGNTVLRMLASVATIAVTAPGDSIIGAGTLQGAATLKDASNNTLTGRPVAWGTSDVNIATVSAAGLITGVASGAATITATAEGQNGTLVVRVLPPVALVTVSAPADSVAEGSTLQATAALSDGASNPITGRPVTWSTSNATIATVNPNTGLVTGVLAGTVTITATSEGQQGIMSIRVVSGVSSVSLVTPGDSIIGSGSLAGVATVRDAAHNPMPGQPLTASSSNTSVATVAPASATTDGSGNVAVTITYVSVGTATITTSSGAASGTLVVRMLAAVNSIVFSPASINNAHVGQNRSMTIDVRDVANTALVGRMCALTSSAPSVASVSPASGVTNSSGQIGLTIAGAAIGSTTITATCGTKQATALVTVS